MSQLSDKFTVWSLENAVAPQSIPATGSGWWSISAKTAGTINQENNDKTNNITVCIAGQRIRHDRNKGLNIQFEPH